MNVLDLSDRQISKLSGGQQQRVLIARALAQNADLLLLDEPLNAVDISTRKTVGDVLHNIKAQGKTVIVATHYYDQEEGRYDKAIYLKDGKKISGMEHH
jgi:manganese/zinc/iron transport system ATP- binding protein